MSSPTPLYQIEESPDLYVEACMYDEQCNLVFLSAWGRDTVDGRRPPVFPNQDLLEKHTTRQFRGTLFGSLLNLWLFD